MRNLLYRKGSVVTQRYNENANKLFDAAGTWPEREIRASWELTPLQEAAYVTIYEGHRLKVTIAKEYDPTRYYWNAAEIDEAGWKIRECGSLEAYEDVMDAYKDGLKTIIDEIKGNRTIPED
jgi:hypothetical protein